MHLPHGVCKTIEVKGGAMNSPRSSANLEINVEGMDAEIQPLPILNDTRS